MSYETTPPYHTEPMQAAAVYCSDGRQCEQCDTFLREGLGLERYDRVVVPGGPGALVGHDGARVNADGVLADLKLLVDAHELDRVVLIQHEDCAFYAVRVGLEAEAIEPTQVNDLAHVAQTVRDVTGVTHVEAYYVRQSDGGVAFEAVTLGAPTR